MTRGRYLLGGIVIVAVIVIAYFAIVSQHPSKNETAGAIGTAKKYRAEQISEKDVVLGKKALAEAGKYELTAADAAALFGRAAPLMRFELLQKGPVAIQAAAFDKATLDERAAIVKTGATDKQLVAMFERLSVPQQKSVCANIGTAYETFGRAPEKEQAASLRKAAAADVDVLLSHVSMQEKGAIVTQLPVERAVPLMGRLEPELTARLVATATPENLAAMFKTATPEEQAAVVKCATPDERQMIVQVAPVEVKAALLEKASAPELAAVFRMLAAREQVAMFKSLPASQQTETLARLGQTMAAFDKLALADKSKLLMERFTPEEQAAMTKNLTLAEKGAAFDLAERTDQEKLMQNATPQQLAACLERLPNVCAAIVGRTGTPATVAFLEMAPSAVKAEFFKSASAQEKGVAFANATAHEYLAMFNSLPAAEQADILNRAHTTAAAFDKLPVCERAGIIVQTATPEEKAACVENAPLEVRSLLYERLGTPMEQDLAQRTSALGLQPSVVREASPAAMAALMGRADPVQLGQLFNKATPEQQVALLAAAPVPVKAELLEKAPAGVQANFYRLCKSDVRCALFERLAPEAQGRVLAAAGVKAEAFANASKPQQAAMLEKAGELEMAGMIVKATYEEKAKLVDQADMQARMKLVQAAPVEAQVKMLQYASQKQMADFMRVLPLEASVSFLQRTFAPKTE